jgi:hypothetical protein
MCARYWDRDHNQGFGGMLWLSAQYAALKQLMVPQFVRLTQGQQQFDPLPPLQAE